MKHSSSQFELVGVLETSRNVIAQHQQVIDKIDPADWKALQDNYAKAQRQKWDAWYRLHMRWDVAVVNQQH